MLLLADKNQQQLDEYAIGMAEATETKNRQRLRSNNYQGQILQGRKDSVARG